MTGRIRVEDESGNEVLDVIHEKEFTAVLISSSKLKENQTYTVIAGDQSVKAVAQLSSGHGGAGMPQGQMPQGGERPRGGERPKLH